jgi:hypothetical protein
VQFATVETFKNGGAMNKFVVLAFGLMSFGATAADLSALSSYKCQVSREGIKLEEKEVLAADDSQAVALVVNTLVNTKTADDVFYVKNGSLFCSGFFGEDHEYRVVKVDIQCN